MVSGRADLRARGRRAGETALRADVHRDDLRADVCRAHLRADVRHQPLRADVRDDLRSVRRIGPRCGWLAIALVAACAPTTVQLPTTPRASMPVGGLSRSIDTVYDLDEVRDVADANGALAVATDHGVLLYADESAPPTRVVDALPSLDVRALATTVDGALIVGTTAGVVAIRGTAAESLGAPPVGGLVALEATTDGTLWACGSVGLARRVGGEWQTYGEPFECTGLWPSPEERLWVGGARGLLYLDRDDVVREHGEASGLPGGYVRGVVPMGDGRALALVQGPSDAWIVYYDGDRWFTYTAPGLERRAVGLERLGGDAVLITPDHAFLIRDAARSTGVALHPLTRGERHQAVSYRARVGAEREHADPNPRAAAPLAPVPANAPTVLAPGFGIAHLARLGDAVSLARSLGDRVIAADQSRGVVALRASGVGARMTSRTLVGSRSLQLAQDARGRAYAVDTLGRVGAWDGAAFTRVATPADARFHAIASGPRGVYAAATVPDDASALRVYRREGEAWAIVLERRIPAGDGAEGGAEASGDDTTSAGSPRATSPSAASGSADSSGATGSSDRSAATGSADAATDSASARGATSPATGSASARGATSPATGSTTGGAGASSSGAESGGEPTRPPGLTLASLPFLGVGTDETAWVALRVREGSRERAFGVVQLDPRSDVVLHHHAGRPAGGRGALQLPDDVTNVDLGQEGFAWFGSVVGAVRVGNFQSVTFGEARGVRGEVVSDVLVGAANKVWVAAAEGPGYYFRQTFEFRMPQAVRDARPLGLALDAQGHVWGAGPRGLVRYDGTDWLVLGEGSVLPTTDLLDVESDAEGRLWVLARDRVLVLGPGRRVE